MNQRALDELDRLRLEVTEARAEIEALRSAISRLPAECDGALDERCGGFGDHAEDYPMGIVDRALRDEVGPERAEPIGDRDGGVPRSTNRNAWYWRTKWEVAEKHAKTNANFRGLYAAERKHTDNLRTRIAECGHQEVLSMAGKNGEIAPKLAEKLSKYRSTGGVTGFCPKCSKARADELYPLPKAN